MVNLFHSGAVMNIDTRLVMLLLVALQSRTILAENYSAAIDTAVGASSGRYGSMKDIGADYEYLKGHSISVGSNGFGYHQQEYQTDDGSTQDRYGSNDHSGGSDEQQSHISAGYHHPQPASGNAYEVVHHQSGIDHQMLENNISHQYEQESDGGTATGVGDGYHSTSEYGGSSSDYHQSDGGFSSSQHQHTDVINYVPYPVVKKLHVPYSKAVHIPISHAVIIPVRKPVPIHIPIAKQVQVPVEKELKIPVERLVPYPVERPVPVPVEKRVPYTVVRYMPVKVAKPYAVKVPVVKTVLHRIKQFW